MTVFYICASRFLLFFFFLDVIDVSSSTDAKSVREQLSLCSPEQSSLHESEGPSAHDTFDQEPHRGSHGERMSH